MPSDVHLNFKSRAGRNIVRRQEEDRSGTALATPQSHLPESDEGQEDAAAVGGNSMFNMSQSILQMITAAGSKTDFNKRYDSSDSDDDRDDDNGVPHNVLRSVATLKKPRNRDRRMLQSTPHLTGLRTKLEPHTEQDIDTDQEDSRTAGPSSPNRILVSPEVPTLHPHMVSAALGAGIAKNETDAVTRDEDEKQADDDLATKLMEIFGFMEVEEVISGTHSQQTDPTWPCTHPTFV